MTDWIMSLSRCDTLIISRIPKAVRLALPEVAALVVAVWQSVLLAAVAALLSVFIFVCSCLKKYLPRCYFLGRDPWPARKDTPFLSDCNAAAVRSYPCP